MSGPLSDAPGVEDTTQPRRQDADDDFGRVDRRIDVAVCFAAFLLGLALVALSTRIRQGSIPDPIGAGGWPKLLGATLMIAMGANIVRRLMSWRASPGNLVLSDGGKDDVPGRPGTVLRPAFMMISGLIWVLIVHWTGFIVATTVLLIAGLLLMQVRQPVKLLLVAFLFSLIFWLLFGEFLGIRLPAGPVEHALIRIFPGLS
ncbi:MAG: tripartite tricarboxylate transporter TctB family protein [Gammaproteobacteria bacterium]